MQIIQDAVWYTALISILQGALSDFFISLIPLPCSFLGWEGLEGSGDSSVDVDPPIWLPFGMNDQFRRVYFFTWSSLTVLSNGLALALLRLVIREDHPHHAVDR